MVQVLKALSVYSTIIVAYIKAFGFQQSKALRVNTVCEIVFLALSFPLVVFYVLPVAAYTVRLRRPRAPQGEPRASSLSLFLPAPHTFCSPTPSRFKLPLAL